MREEIQTRLQRIEIEEQVRIVYACESGSRAWGFPSTDSDYDVRFIYLHPRDWYLSVDLERDKQFVAGQKLIEDADEIFVNGDSFIANARALEPVFKARMFAGVES